MKQKFTKNGRENRETCVYFFFAGVIRITIFSRLRNVTDRMTFPDDSITLNVLLIVNDIIFFK